jgi:phosphatidylinositol alpha-1,6-mannosyltransferase
MQQANMNKANENSILLITRKYPPTVGGMERYSENLFKNLSTQRPVILIANRHGNKFLIPFVIYAFIRALISLPKVQYIHMADSMLAPLGLVLKKISKKQVSVGVMGLDITWKNKLYQKIIPKCVQKLDKVVAISESTKQECIRRGISEAKITVIPIGVDERKENSISKTQWAEKFKINDSVPIFITVGRLVERKGVRHFIENILSKHKQGYQYFIIGDGPQNQEIQKVIQEYSLEKVIYMTGKLSEEVLIAFYCYSNAFIMPNIAVPGDVEGFGIVAIEAGFYGLPVLTTGIEGIADAVTAGKNGLFFHDFESFNSALVSLEKKHCLTGSQLEEYIDKNYSWKNLIQEYLNKVFK